MYIMYTCNQLANIIDKLSSNNLQDVQDRIDNMGTELSKALKKDLQESGMLCQAQYSELCSQLADRKAEITAKTAAYQKVPGLFHEPS